jgi:curli biogenesis system outer membrane secretion channel CsgG
MKHCFALLVPLVAFVAGASCVKGTRADPTRPRVIKEQYNYSCDATVDARLGVHPPGNKSGEDVPLDGMDDILIGELTRSMCFQAIERDKDKLAVLFAELDRCAPENPDRARFDCSTSPQTGKQLLVTHYVFVDLIMYAAHVAAAELEAKFPAVGELQANEEYAAVIMNVRVVDAGTGEVAAASVIHAIVPSAQAKLEVGAHGASLKLTAESSTPMGEALMTMLGKSIEDLHDSWRPTGTVSADATAANTSP